MKYNKVIFGHGQSLTDQTRKPGLIARRIKSNELKIKSKATKPQVRISKLNSNNASFKR